MSENKNDLKVLQEIADQAGIELTDDVIDYVSGGVIPIDVWNQMTPEERRAAQQESMLNKILYKKPCILD